MSAEYNTDTLPDHDNFIDQQVRLARLDEIREHSPELIVKYNIKVGMLGNVYYLDPEDRTRCVIRFGECLIWCNKNMFTPVVN